jgi:hypothetical protein
MKPQDVLAHPANVLTDAQRRAFSSTASWRCPTMCRSAGSCVARGDGRAARPQPHQDQTDSIYVSRKAIRRAIRGCTACSSPQDQHPTFWEFMTDPVMTDLAADVVGPDVKFHHAKLNVKSGKGSRGFSWHQDIPAWPHTDFSPVTIGIYIDGCTAEQGPLTVAEGSHEGAAVLDVRRRRQLRREDPRRRPGLADAGHDPTDHGGPGTTLL